MSHRAMTWATEQVVGSAFGKVILMTLADCADPFGIAFPSPDHIAKVSELSRASVFRWLRVLEKAGMMARIEAPNQHGVTVKAYQLALGRIFDLGVGESQSETDESQTETPKEDGATDRVSVCDSASLSTETPYNPSLIQESLPKPLSPVDPQQGIQEAGTQASPPKPQAEPVVGIRAFVASVPGWELGDMAAVEAEARKLPAGDWRKAQDRAPLYAASLARFKQRPKAPHLWLRKRMFDQFGPAAIAAEARRVFVPEGTPQWQAWLAAFAAAYGGEQRLPAHIGGASRGGFLAASEWPAGGERWIVPRERWVFVEHGTSQYSAWVQRVGEIFHRAPTLVRAAIARDRHRLIGAGADGALKLANGFGLFVPSEWPPRKTEATGPPISQEEIEEFMSNSS